VAPDAKHGDPKRTEGALDKFETGGELGPVENRNQYEQRINSLPAKEKELAQESARFADLCRFFALQKMDLPADALDQLGRVSKLAIPARIQAMKSLNRRLMEYLNDVGQDPGIRQ
jgi:hypothetical protein